MDKINNIAFDLMNEQVDEFTLFEKLKEIHELSLQPQLNDNQQIVLASLKNNAEQYALRINPIACMTHLHIDSLEGGSTSAQEAYISLSDGEEAQVLEVFAKWVHGQEVE